MSSCINEDHSRDREIISCRLRCYDAKTARAVYEVACPNQPQAFSHQDKVSFNFYIKHPRYVKVYEPFQQINENIKDYRVCTLFVEIENK